MIQIACMLLPNGCPPPPPYPHSLSVSQTVNPVKHSRRWRKQKQARSIFCSASLQQPASAASAPEAFWNRGSRVGSVSPLLSLVLTCCDGEGLIGRHYRSHPAASTRCPSCSLRTPSTIAVHSYRRLRMHPYYYVQYVPISLKQDLALDVVISQTRLLSQYSYSVPLCENNARVPLAPHLRALQNVRRFGAGHSVNERSAQLTFAK
ncbi:hypothetical protein PoB_007675500 [Plakobranchus ocellatus]|uniref:Uncharacterized protein n=1 Tax=Plakobranchus ocellatus TaxID=259542 RepID=A0AAV4E1P7_9GAST|nr:hypothetical protein PoB_007675500 [Plakobranchus ocellatus]